MRSPVEDDLAKREAERHSLGGAMIAAYWYSLVSQEPAVVIQCHRAFDSWRDMPHRVVGQNKHHIDGMTVGETLKAYVDARA